MGMEDDTRVFLLKILHTISIILLWMMANVFFGIYKGFAFFNNKPDWVNYLYYIIFLISLIMLLIHLRRKWKV